MIENVVIVICEFGMLLGLIGWGVYGVVVYNGEIVIECVVVWFDVYGVFINVDEVIGELVNMMGLGFFIGYYNDFEVNVECMCYGMYWFGDFVYWDFEGWIYFVGCIVDWMWVDGENLIVVLIE